jgi:anaerobic selenocysteine-containing dehydrogenase
VGCGIVAYVKDERIVDVQGDETHPVSRGRLCARGTAFVQGVTHPERIALPATRHRRNGPLQALDNLEKALDLLAERLQKTRDRHGPAAMAIGCDPQAGLDFFLGALRFAELWGTPHVYHPFMKPQGPGFPEVMLDSPTPCTEWPKSRCLFLVEADLAMTHPVAFGWVLDAQRQGAKVCAVDAGYTATLSKADKSAVIRPGSGNQLGLAIMKYLVEEGLCADKLAMDQIAEAENWEASYRAMSVDSIESLAGISPAAIQSIARLLAAHTPVTIITGSRLACAPHYGIWPTMIAKTGWAAMAGGGWHPLETGWSVLYAAGQTAGGANNAGGPLEPAKSIDQDAPDGVSAAGQITPKAMICTGDSLNHLLLPFQPSVADADVVAYFGTFPNQTWECADLVFPAATWVEEEGLWFSDNGTVQWGHQVVRPCQNCCSGLGFWARLAQRFGWEADFPWMDANGRADHRVFYDWVLNEHPATAGLDVNRLRETSEPVFLSTRPPAASEKNVDALQAPARLEPEIASDDADRFPLMYHSTLSVSHCGGASRWWPWTREVEPEDRLQVHPEIAEALGIVNGEAIQVAGAEDAWKAKAWISRMVNRHTVWSHRCGRLKRVLIYKKGQSPDEARNILKAILL